jgi:hypothetical protein
MTAKGQRLERGSGRDRAQLYHIAFKRDARTTSGLSRLPSQPCDRICKVCEALVLSFASPTDRARAQIDQDGTYRDA